MKQLLALLALSVATTAQASTWVGISSFNVLANSNLSTFDATSENIRILGVGVTNPDGCTDADSYIVDSTLTAKTKDRIYAMLLAAAASQQTIWILVGGCQANRPGVLNAAFGKPASLF